MVKVLFVCHGNICRSPMAESVLSDLVKKRGWEKKVFVSSAATREDALGCSPHRGTREALEREKIPLVPHVAILLVKRDGEEYDFIIGMDRENLRDMKRIVGEKNEKKLSLLLEHAGLSRDVADPWYTHDFTMTMKDVLLGCSCLLEEISPLVEKVI